MSAESHLLTNHYTKLSIFTVLFNLTIIGLIVSISKIKAIYRYIVKIRFAEKVVVSIAVIFLIVFNNNIL